MRAALLNLFQFYSILLRFSPPPFDTNHFILIPLFFNGSYFAATPFCPEKRRVLHRVVLLHGGVMLNAGRKLQAEMGFLPLFWIG